MSNAAFAYLTLGSPVAMIALPMWLGLGISFRFFLKAQSGVYKAYIGSVLTTVVLMTIEALYLQYALHFPWLKWLRDEIHSNVNELLTVPQTWIKTMVDETGQDVVENSILHEIPSTLLMLLLIAQFLNLWVASRLSKGFLTRAFWGAIRIPFGCVWITMIFGASTLLGNNDISWLGGIGLKVMLTLHAFQGVSILTNVFNRLQWFGLIRVIVFTLLLVTATPLIVGLGFFDQWFDFRKKIAQ